MNKGMNEPLFSDKHMNLLEHFSWEVYVLKYTVYSSIHSFIYIKMLDIYQVLGMGLGVNTQQWQSRPSSYSGRAHILVRKNSKQTNFYLDIKLLWNKLSSVVGMGIMG